MLKRLLRKGPEQRPRAMAGLVSAILRGGETAGRDLLARLRAAGRPLSAAGFRQLMANLQDAGLVRYRRGTWRYAWVVARKPRQPS